MQGEARGRTGAYIVVCEDASPTCLSADRSDNAADGHFQREP
jgi:hypothetical protein